MVRTQLTDTPLVEEGGDQVRVSREELAVSCCVETIGVSGKDGGTGVWTKYIQYKKVMVIISLTSNNDGQ